MRNEDNKDYITEAFLKHYDNNEGCRKVCSLIMDDYIKSITNTAETRINKVYDSLQKKTNKLQTRNKNSVTKSK